MSDPSSPLRPWWTPATRVEVFVSSAAVEILLEQDRQGLRMIAARVIDELAR
jgi:hypothetical protein